MPFKSRAQQKLLFAKHPDVAEKFAEHTTKEEEKNLPEYVSRDKNGLKAYTKKHRRKRDE
jgi:hypothetical protein